LLHPVFSFCAYCGLIRFFLSEGAVFFLDRRPLGAHVVCSIGAFFSVLLSVWTVALIFFGHGLSRDVAPKKTHPPILLLPPLPLVRSSKFAFSFSFMDFSVGFFVFCWLNRWNTSQLFRGTLPFRFIWCSFFHFLSGRCFPRLLGNSCFSCHHDGRLLVQI